MKGHRAESYATYTIAHHDALINGTARRSKSTTSKVVNMPKIA